MNAGMIPGMVERVNDSLERCGGTALTRRFYALFIASSAEVRELFKDVDMKKQQREVTASLYMMMMASQQGVGAREFLQQVAQTHHQRKIPPEMYALWLECLLRAVAETDPLYNDRVGAAWREMMAPGIEFMKSHAV